MNSNPNIYLGLNEAQVNARKRKGQVNYDTTVPTKSYKQIIYGNIFTLFNVINLVLGGFIISTGSYKNLMFLGVAFCNTIISMAQEMRSKHVVDKLAILSSTKANVVRSGKDKQISVNDIVLDDIIKYRLGNQVVVDSIIEEGTVEVDESFITGEADSILKQKGDKLLSGSFIVSGDCISKVVSVGDDNYTNKISKEAKYLKTVNSEIMSTLKKIIKIISITIIPLGIILFIKQINVDGATYNEAIVSVVAALIGTIPEGLVLLTSTVLAISSMRLAKKKILVQELYCIENLARVDTICLDKTGTLTSGKLNVSKVIKLMDVDISEIMANISNYMTDGGATAVAIRAYFHPKTTFSFVNKVAFSSKKKCSIYEFKEGTYIIGAKEFINYHSVIPNIDEYASKYRVLVVAKNNEHIIDNDVKMPFRPIALILVEDEIRNGALKTLNYLRNEDVDIKIISGDSTSTVSTIARQIGFDDIRPFDMTKVDDKTNILDLVQKYNIFGRVTPSQKKDLVIALKANGHKVAMTGDGVNDVLSLKEADCSITLASGSDAARNVSQIVLLKSDFKDIPAIVKEGRRSINNLERSASLFLTKTIYAAILAILFVFINMDYPFIPIQLTLLGALTIGIPSFVLALEPNHNRVKGRFFINIIRKAIPAALTIVANVIGVIIIARLLSFSDDDISTMSVILVAFTGFVLLFRVCYPFNYLRGILFGSLIGVFLGSVIGFRKLLELVVLSPLQFGFIALLCLIDIAVFNLLTILCEKKIFKYEERIVK